MSRRPDVLVVAPNRGGHHGEYLRWITRGLLARGLAVSVAAHPAHVADAHGADVRPLPDAQALADAGSAWARGRALAAMTRRAVADVGPRRVLLPYLDPLVLPLAFGLRLPAPVVGLLFRVTTHETASGLGEHAKRAAKTAVLRLAARNPALGAVLPLDPDAVGPLRQLGLDARWAPDPVEPPRPQRSPAEVRAALGVEPDRHVAVLFGSLEDRKGAFETLDALGRMAPEDAARLAVVVVGRTYDDVRPRLLDAVAAGRETRAQVVFQERFVPDAELDDLTTAADAVLAPYLGHVGSSGVVLRAAASGTPVLATSAGMVGREVRRHRLGQTVDPADGAALAAALGRVARGERPGFDAAGAAAYAREHAVERFVDAVAGALAP